MTSSTDNNINMRANIRERIRKDFVGTTLLGIVLFLAAGRLDWSRAWVYMALSYAGMALNILVLIRKNPAVLAARADVIKAETKDWDRIFVALYGPLLMLIMLVSGLDAGRFAWSRVPLWVVWLGLVIFVLAWLFTLWAFVANKHFETSVRIQEARGHEPVTFGPYAIVRHPGYVGVILIYAASPLLLGSLWGLLASSILVMAFVLRTAWEDRTLQEELEGYAEYAQRVRFRLLPGVW